MEKYLEAATKVWNPVSEVRRRRFDRTLDVRDVLPSSVAAIVACNLFWFAGWNFFWNMVLQQADPSLPEVKTSQFIVQLASMAAAVVPIAALPVLPSFIFAPVGRGAVAAAIVLLIAADAFYTSAFGSIAFFIAGGQAFEDPRQALQTFVVLSKLIAVLEIGLLLFFWFRIGLSELGLSLLGLVGISLASGFSLVVVFGALAWAAS